MSKMPEDSPPAVVALILAGGNSRRMGSDKALVLWDGIPLLRRVAQVAAACADAVYILTPWPERYAPVVDPGWHLWRENVHSRDSVAEQHRGPLLAFQEGIRRLQTLAAPPEWILLLACDLPCLQEQVLGDWRQRLATLPPQTVAALPKSQRGWEPLCGFYRLAQLGSLESFLQAGGRSFQGWLSQVPTAILPLTVPDSGTESLERMLTNCNTPADLQLGGNLGRG
ncbi:molybdenum cofactor guanylyltransferase [Synechococcus sp. JA-2-3B'a(2-13)]|jgi:molybdopterin-guanine dinucleotide biosynthesis protein A|uniref:molybdenum cofactor guanylyltransferase n=1 Tax=Synechococcus sp. (strain JA-2-3B'a(2-13)) TaxID=321332 RepID=UPI000302CDE5|nr:molybdenum cofactor guanylyltransferase [Synechococcus sp. JA-2-3B'a(2-13)]